MIKPEDIIAFWYSEPINKSWFKSTPEIDLLIREQFESVWSQAADGILDFWKESAQGCLALIIILDQFPLNMYRGQAKSFTTEAASIDLVLYGLEQGFDKALPKEQLSFFFMPLMHSEILEHQNLSVKMFGQAGFDENTRFATHHRSIIERFGRFPHRNIILGRVSSSDELEYLSSKEAFTG